jgi:DNA-binding GntR family transcriptional regulator
MASRSDGDSLYNSLRSAVLDGTFELDEPLREVALSAQYGVSRTPVREALNRLLHDNLLERRGRGLYVRSVPLEEVLQIYEVRVLLEGEAASQAADSRRKSDLLTLQMLLERDRGLVDPSDEERTRTNLEFHAAIWNATNNRVLRDILDRLTTHLVHAPMSTLSVGDRWTEALDEHAAIVEAIASRNGDEARTLAQDHMRTARDLRIRLLASSPRDR